MGEPVTKAEYLAFHKDACMKMIEITRAKNADYAGAGDDPFSNFRQIGSLVQKTPNVVAVGFLTRMSDKMSRIGSFVDKGSLEVKDESVEDTLLDLANYCLLFAGFLKSQRPKVAIAPWSEKPVAIDGSVQWDETFEPHPGYVTAPREGTTKPPTDLKHAQPMQIP